MSKVQRQATISRLIGDHEVTSQPQLIELLAEHGIDATQATVSRDLDDIGAIKVRVPSGNTVYAIPEFAPDRLAPVDQLRRVMGEWVADVACSGNLVILRTPPGCAHVVASALDRSRVAVKRNQTPHRGEARQNQSGVAATPEGGVHIGAISLGGGRVRCVVE